MISNPAISHPAMGPHQFTLNDLRVCSYAADEKPSNSTFGVSGMILVAAVVIGAFVMLDPLHLFVPSEPKSAAPEFAPPTRSATPVVLKEIPLPQLIVPATRSIEEPAVAPAVVQASRQPAPVPATMQRSAGTTPESPGNAKGKTDATTLRAGPRERPAPPVIATRLKEKAASPAILRVPEEKAAPPLLLTKPEENPAPPAVLIKPEAKPDIPLASTSANDVKDAPKPAAASNQSPVKEEVN